MLPTHCYSTAAGEVLGEVRIEGRGEEEKRKQIEDSLDLYAARYQARDDK